MSEKFFGSAGNGEPASMHRVCGMALDPAAKR